MSTSRTIYNFEDGTSGTAYVIDAATPGPLCDTTHVMHGTKAVKVVSSGSYQYDQVNFNALTDLAVGYYFYATGAPGSDLDQLLLYNGQASTAATDRLTIRRESTGHLRVFDSASAQKWQSAAIPAANTWYRVELRYQSTGTLTIAYYAGDSTTAIEGPTALTGCTVPPSINNARLGKRVSGATTTAITEWYDDWQIEQNPSTAGNWPLGPTPVSAAPTANAGPDQQSVEPFTTVTLDGAGSQAASGSSITGYAWTQTGGTTVALSSTTTAQPTFTAPASIAGTTLTFSLVVTATGGVTSTADTVFVTVLPQTVFRLEVGTPTPLLVARL